MEDIVPEILGNIQKQFNERTLESDKLKKAVAALKAKKATYLDVNDFAIEVGEILADVFNLNITAEVLPDGQMYFNIADRILNSTLSNNYELISGYASDVQTLLNREAGMRLRAQDSEFNQDRVDGIVNRVSTETDFDGIKWILNEPIVNFSQSIVDDVIKANIDFHAKSGLNPTITRKTRGDACAWCLNLAGTYEYGSEPSEIYQRHDRCRCTVEYNPKDSRGLQNSHTKKWLDPNRKAKIAARKNIGLRKEETE